MTKKTREATATTLPFDKFLGWLRNHANCILRCGTLNLVLFDQEDCHWNIIVDDQDALVVQLCRAKELVAEMLIAQSDISYVQCESNPELEEFTFDCLIDLPSGQEVGYQFVLSHEYEDGEISREDKWTH